MTNKKEKEIETMARKMVLLNESSLKVINIAADVLLARDQMENGKKKEEERELQEV